jgi:GT2 family glycosyltransferase
MDSSPYAGAVAIYSLTRDRLEYTKACFASLQEKAGLPFFHHIVVDNGSEDGTAEWLRMVYKPTNPDQIHIIPLDRNYGISRGSNVALEAIFKAMPRVDVICKVDNDCLVISDGVIRELARLVDPAAAAGPFGERWVLSPRVEGITRQPTRARYGGRAGYRVGFTAIVGGLCHVAPAELYRTYRFPETLPLAAGQDDHFCHWVKTHGGQVGYVENMIVQHYETTDGQAVRYPDYFKRKWAEEKTLPEGVRA